MRGHFKGAMGPLLCLAVLSLCKSVVDACSCMMGHPQELFCGSEVVIRAKVVGEKILGGDGNEGGHDPFSTIQYEVKQVKMFRGFDKMSEVKYVYTPLHDSLCGVRLQVNNVQYVLGGSIRDGKLHIGLCGLIMTWDALTLSQKKSLNHRYQMGCDCRIKNCNSLPCAVTDESECLWTDWLIERKMTGHQAKHYSCIKRKDGSCTWYRGGPPPEKDFHNAVEP